MSTKHTPGPWLSSGTGGHEIHGQHAVYAESGGRDIAIVYDGEANARLIAAAPEMYEALKAVRHIVEADMRRMMATIGTGEDADGKRDGAVAYIEQLDAALAKVEGGQ